MINLQHELLGPSWVRQEVVVAGAGQKVILQDRPDLKSENVHAVPVGAIITQDERDDRVRMFVDTVAEIPRVG